MVKLETSKSRVEVTLSTDSCLGELSFVLGSQFLIVDHIP